MLHNISDYFERALLHHQKRESKLLVAYFRYDGKPVILGLRPEAITELGGTSHQNPRCQIECHVEIVEPAGSDTFVVLPFGAKEVIARVQSENQIRAGEPAMFYFNMAKAVLFDPDTEQRIA